MQYLTLLFLSLIFGVAGAFAQNTSLSKPYILSFPPDCDAASLSIDFSFNSGGGFVHTDSKRCVYEIPTSDEEVSVRSLKIVVRGPKYKTLIFDFPSIDKNGGKIEAKLEPHTQIEFKGKISSSESITDSWMQLTVFYLADWKCELYHRIDCFLGPDRIATADIDAEGRFKVLLPDFASDPALAGFQSKGRFSFFLSDRKDGNRVYDLQSEMNRSDISVASKYPGTHLFVARRAR